LGAATQRRALFESWTAGAGHRGWAAHANANEALASFAPAAVAAVALHAPAAPAAALAAVVLAARALHAPLYWAGLDAPRSITHAFGAHATAALYALCIWPNETAKLLGA
jgi:uncharacterized MAPEG superfamily protein